MTTCSPDLTQVKTQIKGPYFALWILFIEDLDMENLLESSGGSAVFLLFEFMSSSQRDSARPDLCSGAVLDDLMDV